MKPSFITSLLCLFISASAVAADGIEKPVTTTLRFECFSMPRAQARRAFLTTPKPVELYNWLVAESEKKEPTVKMENLSVIRTLSGQRTQLNATADSVYATEFDGAQIQQTFNPSGKKTTSPTDPVAPPKPPTPPQPTPPSGEKPAGNQGDAGLPGPAMKRKVTTFPYTPITPTTFETRKTGWAFEVEPAVSDDRKLIDLTLAPEFVQLGKKISYDKNGETWQPIFLTQKLNTNISCKVNEPTLVGTMNPSPDVGVGIPEQKNQVWFLYVTVSLQ